MNALLGSRFFQSHDWAGTGSWPGEEYIRWEMGERADDILAGFRRQGPITDAQVQAAFESWNGLHVGTVRDRLRAALEAARDA